MDSWMAIVKATFAHHTAWWNFHYESKKGVRSENVDVPGRKAINLGDAGTGAGNPSSNEISKQQQTN